ncbi:acyl-CoA dehydrogenase family protein [Nocardia amikacinitolerans]|uniref:acyl-CoA dehydrogenase family protein n=1 Tax=Nocardia amikacinitolerans TaxID=756689 RepID=UPI0020A2B029|nr:acyl-CoA dehydrogenase family protein [Nocardia amikacinitolerans]MCP2293338.1 Acyl-CoA dehydrogenase [Nocardia amikacinitolerans]
MTATDHRPTGSDEHTGATERLDEQVRRLLAEHDPRATEPLTFLRARFDAGLAWIDYPPGLGGLGAPRSLQPRVDALFTAAQAPTHDLGRIGVGVGMAAPTILAHGTDEQQKRWLRPLWTGEEVWCQLFSEPGAGSDLAAVSTRAVRDGDSWIVNGQKVWTSMAHVARWAILVARTDPAATKHRGLTYFACDMSQPGVDVRPLRQATGEAEFNEVFLTDVRIPDADRIGDIGAGWGVAMTTLQNERVFIGGAAPREDGLIGIVADLWRRRPELRTAGLRERLITLWIDAEAARLAGERARALQATGRPGNEGAGAKIAYARLNQAASSLELDLLGEEGLHYEHWAMRRPESVDFRVRSAGYRFLRAKGNSIEGGTTEILRNIIAERVLGLPPEARNDTSVAWKDLPR